MATTLNAVLLTEEQAKECSKHPLATAVAARFPALLRAMLAMLLTLILGVVFIVWHIYTKSEENHYLSELALHKGAVWVMLFLTITAFVLAWELHWMRKFALSPEVLAAACGIAPPVCYPEKDPVLRRRPATAYYDDEEDRLYRHLQEACRALSEHAAKHAHLSQHARTRADLEKHLAIELMARAACELLEMSKKGLTPHCRPDPCQQPKLDSD